MSYWIFLGFRVMLKMSLSCSGPTNVYVPSPTLFIHHKVEKRSLQAQCEGPQGKIILPLHYCCIFFIPETLDQTILYERKFFIISDRIYWTKLTFFNALWPVRAFIIVSWQLFYRKTIPTFRAESRETDNKAIYRDSFRVWQRDIQRWIDVPRFS